MRGALGTRTPATRWAPRARRAATTRLALGLIAAVAAGAACARRAGTGEAGPAARPALPTSTTRVPLAVTADTVFWRTLHAGQYDSIPRAMLLLKAAYLQNPRDARTTAHIGFLHAWVSAERARLASVPPTITDNLILARTYFARAAVLDPTDARVLGFHASFEMSDAGLQRDSAAFAVALARGRAAIAAWPEFNWFTIGYTLSGREHASPLFREAVAMQWQTLDACSRTSVDRTNPTAAVVLRAEATEQDPRHRRACWNSWIAPHNVEGFLLNMGDMLVKSGDWRTGVRVYALARGMTSYPRWAFRDVLETRIAQAEQNVAAFRRPEAAGADGPRLMLGSRFACVACHQQ
jgi:hypothetical protein